MEELIKALTILRGFMKPENNFPTACEHDILYVRGVDYGKISAKDVQELAKLGFLPGSDEDWASVEEVLGEVFDDFEQISEEQWEKVKNECWLDDCFRSYKYGSC